MFVKWVTISKNFPLLSNPYFILGTFDILIQIIYTGFFIPKKLPHRYHEVPDFVKKPSYFVIHICLYEAMWTIHVRKSESYMCKRNTCLCFYSRSKTFAPDFLIFATDIAFDHYIFGYQFLFYKGMSIYLKNKHINMIENYC